MNFFLLTVCRARQRIYCSLFFLLFVGCQIFLPCNGWAQSFSDTGSFTFSGSHNPRLTPGNYREFLPGDGLKVGPVQIHPFLGVAETYTDNVFRTNKRRRSDFLTTIAPGVQALLPFGGKHSFLVDYRAGQFLYSKFSGNNALAQNAIGHITLDFPGGLRIDVDQNFVSGFDNRGSEVDSQQVDITKWNSNTFRTTAQFVGNKIGVRGGVRYTQLDYRNNGQDRPRDRNNAAANFTVFVPASATTSALLGVFVSDQDYSENKQLDSFAYGVFTGFRLAPSRQLSGEINVGYTILNFDRAPVVPGPLIPDTNPLNPGGFIRDPADRATQLLDQGLSLGGKQQKALFIDGSLRWRPMSGLSFLFRPFRLIQQSAVFNTSTFTQTGAVFRARKRLNDRLYILGSLSYRNNDFEEGRTDNRYSFRTSLDYRTVKWLGFRLAYAYQRRFANQTIFRFNANTISFSIQAFL